MMYPDWQWKFWLRSIFVRWDHFAYGRAGRADAAELVRGKGEAGIPSAQVMGGVAVGAAVATAVLARSGDVTVWAGRVVARLGLQ
jgi:hypothetical protein